MSAGPKSVLVKKLSAERLTHAIAEAEEEDARKRVQDIGQIIRSGDGAAQAIDMNESHMAKCAAV